MEWFRNVVFNFNLTGVYQKFVDNKATKNWCKMEYNSQYHLTGKMCGGQMWKQLRNKFHFSDIHRSMNAMGLMQSK